MDRESRDTSRTITRSTSPARTRRMIVVALCVPTSSLVLVDGDLARWDAELLNGVVPRLLLLPGEVLIVCAHACREL